MIFRTGMFTYAFAFLLGVVFVQQLSLLPNFLQYLLPLTSVLLLCLFLRYIVISRYCIRNDGRLVKAYFTLISLFILMIIIGINYSIYFSKQQLDHRLDETLAGQNIIVTGLVSSLPVVGENSQRFEFDVDGFSILASGGSVTPGSLAKIPGKLRLSWYYGKAVNAGETWQLEVRLKPPHGFMNPGGFDYEGWLFQQGIHATGYVRESEFNRRLLTASAFSIDRIRQYLSQQLDIISLQKQGREEATADPGVALVKALAIGDKSSISVQQWRVLRNTGTSHLMAISGLHIGLAAMFGYILIRRIVPVYMMKRIPAQHVALVAGLVLALLYALIAGLSIPTQRAITMLFTLSLMTLLRRNGSPVDSLGLAMMVVLVIDPAAVLSAGFWFSYSAVAVIYISVLNGYRSYDSTLDRLTCILKQWLKLQLMISLFLLPLSLFMFQQASLISPLVNLLLIPYVSFLVVPVILLAIICSFLFHDIAAALFHLAAALLDFIWPVSSYLSAQPYAFWVKGDVDIVELLLATAAMLLLYFSKPIAAYAVTRLTETDSSNTTTVFCWLLRCMGCLLFIPLLTTESPILQAGDYQLTVLDVGQGSAAVVRTGNHVLVFDSGAKFSDRMDAGSSVLLPYLRSQGIKKLDRLIISHGDMDHIGGAQTILDSFPEADIVGQDIDSLVLQKAGAALKQNCYDGMHWRWDGVLFKFLSPDPSADNSRSSNRKTEKRNNHSCVLRVSSSSGSVLFTGDIEKSVEEQLLRKYPGQISSDILIVPHHGSNTSSSPAFIGAVDPKLSLISVGYRNRYRLPSAQVTARYEAAGSDLMTTEKNGAITIRLLAEEGISVEGYRKQVQKYWHHRWH